MRRRPALVIIALLVSACGSDSTIVAGNDGAEFDRQLPPTTTTVDSSNNIDAPPTTTSEAQLTALASDDARCLALSDLLVGPGNVIEVGIDDAAAATRLEAALSRIHPDAGAAITTVFELAESTEYDLDEVLDLYTLIDTTTFEACAIPTMSAALVLSTVPSVVRFCEVDRAIGGPDEPAVDEPAPCPPSEPAFPTSLPCFAPTGDALSMLTEAYEAVDCMSGEVVEWDAYGDGAWVPDDTSSDTFTPVDQAIG